MDREQFLSVGIDVGTSTSQVMFSRMTVENTAGYFTVPSLSIVNKQTLYQGEIYRTPLRDDTTIDADRLAQLVEREYNRAGIKREQVKTGAVIITGEAARKENAAVVLQKLSSFAGDFVVSTAGPDLESVIAGKGSGAWQYSEENGVVTANLDIGGGTTNIAVFDGGQVIAKGCLDIGGRQVTIDENRRITYISQSAKQIAEAFSLPLPALGEEAEEESLAKLCDAMCSLLADALSGADTDILDAVWTKGASRLETDVARPIRNLCFSGGVSDCIGNVFADPFCYGDIGVLLGTSVARSAMCRKYRVLQPEQTIRATVIGAGNYTTTVSGSTIAYAEGIFPMKNVPVLKLSPEEEAGLWRGGKEEVCAKIRWFLAQNDSACMALALTGRPDPDYPALKSFADALADALSECLPGGAPLLVIVKEDIAKALGQMMRQRLGRGRESVVLDEISAGSNDYIDFGYPIMGGIAIPVVVKTLIFEGKEGGPGGISDGLKWKDVPV